jgi:hypothetical protein
MTACHVAKVDMGLQLVIGWALISSENGKPYVDSQGDEIPDEVVLPAVTAYMQRSRAGWLEHRPGEIGTVLLSFVLTDDIAAALGITCSRRGWVVGMRVHDPEILKAFSEGRLTGFSIGGRCKSSEVDHAQQTA